MKNKLHIIIETLLVGLLVFLLTITNILSPLENIASDSLYQIPRGIDSKIKIIGIDERTTMDIDTTVKGLPMDAEVIEPIIRDILSIELF